MNTHERHMIVLVSQFIPKTELKSITRSEKSTNELPYRPDNL